MGVYKNGVIRRMADTVAFGAGPNNAITEWRYVTNDDAAAIEAAGHFNELAGRLQKGSLIYCSLDMDGTPTGRVYQVVSNAAGVVGVAKLVAAAGGGSEPPALQALTISSSSATVGTAGTWTVSGRTPGSTLALSGAGAQGLAIDNDTGVISGAPTATGAVNVIETLGSATRTTAGLITVAGSVATPVALDAPLSSAMVAASLGLYAFGFDRLVDGYTGNTVRLKELTNNTTHDFGVDSTGRFNVAAVNDWAPTADLDVVQFFDQMVSGLALTPAGTAAVRRSGAFKRFGTDLDMTTGLLTRNPSFGGLAVDLAGVGHFTLTGTAIDVAANGLEIHQLWSNNLRKIANNDGTDPLGGSTAQEFIMAYGANSNLMFRCQLSNANAGGTSRFSTSSTDTLAANFAPQTNSQRWTANEQNVHSIAITATNVFGYGWGRRFYSLAMTANMQAAVAAGSLNNGTLHIGASFSSASSSAASTSTRLNGLFGGVIVTKALTDNQRFLLQCKLSLVGQQHLAATASEILGLFDEVALTKNVDSSGLLTGQKAQMGLQFNKGGSGTDWDFGYVIPNLGIQGIRSPSFTPNNRFAANNYFYAGVSTGTIMSIHYNEQTGPELHYTWAREDESYANGSGLTTRGNLALGFDHNASGVISKWAMAKDTESLFVGRYRTDPTLPVGYRSWGAAVYEAGGAGTNQSMGKYNVNCTHNWFAYDESMTDSGTTYKLTKTWWETGADTYVDPDTGVTAPPYALDAPVQSPVPSNVPAAFRNDCLLLHIADFQAPAGYDPGADYATRKAQRLSGKVDSFISPLGTPLAHIDGGYARNHHAGVADGGSKDKIQSMTFAGNGFKGTRVAMGWKAGVMSLTDKQKVAMNAYKLVA